jgi:hypothetical protein
MVFISKYALFPVNPEIPLGMDAIEAGLEFLDSRRQRALEIAIAGTIKSKIIPAAGVLAAALEEQKPRLAKEIDRLELLSKNLPSDPGFEAEARQLLLMLRDQHKKSHSGWGASVYSPTLEAINGVLGTGDKILDAKGLAHLLETKDPRVTGLLQEAIVTKRHRMQNAQENRYIGDIVSLPLGDGEPPMGRVFDKELAEKLGGVFALAAPQKRAAASGTTDASTTPLDRYKEMARDASEVAEYSLNKPPPALLGKIKWGLMATAGVTALCCLTPVLTGLSAFAIAGIVIGVPAAGFAVDYLSARPGMRRQNIFKQFHVASKGYEDSELGALPPEFRPVRQVGVALGLSPIVLARA